MALQNFIITREDWSLHRKGEVDQQRHRQKVREAIKKNLADIVSEESIILSDGRRVVKIPIRSLEQYRFRYDFRKQKHAGQGNGNSKVGDIIDSDSQQGPGKGPGAGDQPGYDYYEADVTMEEIEEIVFQDLSLPNLEEKKNKKLASESVEFRDVRKYGIQSNIDRKRTILEVLKRNALKGKPGIHGITPEDLRYKTWEVVPKYESSAVVIAMMDTSGSMGPFEKYIARSFFFWMVRFLRTKYQNVEIVFLAHHTEAKEVTEEEFFTKGESGGTRCSSVYKLALDIIDSRYPRDDYNIYAFHFSDGDNLTSDNEQCIKLIEQLLMKCQLVGYGEIEGPYYYTSTLSSAYKRVTHPRFVSVSIRDKSGVYPALKTFFKNPDQKGG
ncbi:sporulation protein YhbH [Desulfotomaculum nigrificans CO-1-SRB]|uniref:Sporulation protein YhbH n=1 Tax=Desulfotomaculum nigrificans (strain DSM 14880 / VKM B-2319 / CO-1-SRB) TaxID=868595 RepID=F6B3J7_DESCC|nr:sporulation protein YhbH [Desulfotomaculum nigrificans]AEF94026.1 sporulation protein YhbH [Desulfotomaculum nigrificans CO-1-SRB]